MTLFQQYQCTQMELSEQAQGCKGPKPHVYRNLAKFSSSFWVVQRSTFLCTLAYIRELNSCSWQCRSQGTGEGRCSLASHSPLFWKSDSMSQLRKVIHECLGMGVTWELRGQVRLGSLSILGWWIHKTSSRANCIKSICSVNHQNMKNPKDGEKNHGSLILTT